MFANSHVTAIAPRPRPRHHLATATFKHHGATIIDVFTDAEEDPIGSTPEHPFWPEDQQTWISADALRLGENVRLADGSTASVAAVTHRPGTHAVYNLEVDTAHVFYVSPVGVLVHNSCVGQRTGPIQKHHKISWDNKTYNHHNHLLVKQAQARLRSDPTNIMDLGNHAGRHSKEYHLAIRHRMDAAYAEVAGGGQEAA